MINIVIELYLIWVVNIALFRNQKMLVIICVLNTIMMN